MLPTPFANIQAQNAYSSDSVNLTGAWNQLWDAVPGDAGFWNIITVIGIMMVVFSLLSYLWQHRRGTGWGNGYQVIIGMLIIGAVMMAPSLIIPLLLNIVDFFIDFFIGIMETGD